MYVTELNRDQLKGLKEGYLIAHNEEVGEETSLSDLIGVDEILSDNFIYSAFCGVDFKEEDFWN